MSFVLAIMIIIIGPVLMMANETPDCRILDDTPLHSIRVNLTQEKKEQLEVEGQCFLACAIRVYKISKRQPEVIIEGHAYWSYINISGISCSTSAQIHECTRGCIRSYRRSMPLSGRNCPASCVDSCTESQGCDPLTSDCHPWIRRQCEITCDGSFHFSDDECVLGCRLTPDVFEGTPPLNPTGPPQLIPERSIRKAGQYSILLSDAVLERGSGSNAGHGSVVPVEPVDIVAFLIKFEEVYSHNISYNWVASLDHLDLSLYACQELDVSFAVSNLAGLSEFSSPTRVIVYGDEVPDPSTHIRIESEALDERIGFFGHVILIVSWNGPQNKAYLDFFNITITPTMDMNEARCGNDTWSTSVSNDTTMVTIDDFPVTSCHYNIQVYSVASNGRSMPSEILIHHITTTFNHSDIIFDCQRLWQPPEFLFSLTWTLPAYLSRGGVISEFLVNIELRNTSKNPPDSVPVINETIIYPMDGNTRYSEVLHSSHQNLTYYSNPQVMSSEAYLIEMSVMWNSSSIPYVPPLHIYPCVKSTRPPAPSLVENITVTSCLVNDSAATLHIGWSPPLVINGELDYYNIWIGREVLQPLEEREESDYSTKQTTFSTTEELPFLFYIQIRGRNLYAAGNWSSPYEISTITGMCQTATSESVGNMVATIVGPLIGGLILALLGISILSVTTPAIY